MPSITVVIPTVGRPELARSIESALKQAVTPMEILVVADTAGPVPIPEHKLVKLLRVGPRAGGNAARQAGIENARGDLVALLDDDDEWLEDHLSNQLELIARNSTAGGDWIAASRLRAKYPNGKSRIWPQRLKSDAESLPQYIFRKHKISGGIGFIQASTLMFPRQLALEVPFDPSLKFHQDISWLVDLSKLPRPILVLQVESPTVIHYLSDNTVSKKITSRQSRDWAKERLGLTDKRTLGDFILVHSIQGDKNARSLRGMLWTVAAAIKDGRPSIWAFLYAGGLIIRTSFTKLVDKFRSR